MLATKRERERERERKCTTNTQRVCERARERERKKESAALEKVPATNLSSELSEPLALTHSSPASKSHPH